MGQSDMRVSVRILGIVKISSDKVTCGGPAAGGDRGEVDDVNGDPGGGDGIEDFAYFSTVCTGNFGIADRDVSVRVWTRVGHDVASVRAPKRMPFRNAGQSGRSMYLCICVRWNATGIHLVKRCKLWSPSLLMLERLRKQCRSESS